MSMQGDFFPHEKLEEESRQEKLREAQTRPRSDTQDTAESAKDWVLGDPVE